MQQASTGTKECERLNRINLFRSEKTENLTMLVGKVAYLCACVCAGERGTGRRTYFGDLKGSHPFISNALLDTVKKDGSWKFFAV